jgi:hypothetical protein|eukprot:6454920-Prymnesium_polylepis.1
MRQCYGWRRKNLSPSSAAVQTGDVCSVVFQGGTSSDTCCVVCASFSRSHGLGSKRMSWSSGAPTRARRSRKAALHFSARSKANAPSLVPTSMTTKRALLLRGIARQRFRNASVAEGRFLDTLIVASATRDVLTISKRVELVVHVISCEMAAGSGP